MAQVYELHAESRSLRGKGASRRLRRTEQVPAIMYGAGKEPQALILNHNQLTKALQNEAFYSHILTVHVDGKSEKAILKALQRHPYKPKILHLDLQRIDESHEITMHVPLHFLGEEVAPGVKTGRGTVIHHMFDIEVSCLPANLPEFIEVDVSNLDIGDSIHLAQIKLPQGVQSVALAHDEDAVLVSIEEPRVASEEEEAPAEAAKGEGEAAAE